MAEFEPNKYQKQFLEASNCNLLVSASAGSGKTSTMIQKLVRILSKDREPINSLLVVTYTNAAASEIKIRLYNELSKLISSTSDIKEKNFLKEQLDNINNAEIGTLHAICKKLIVKYFYELEESPDFTLLSDKEQKYLLDLAVNNVFSNHITKEDDEFFELYDSYNSNRSDMQLKKMALQLYNFKVSKTDYNNWKNDFLNNSYNESLDTNSACNYLLEYYQKYIMSFSSEIIRLKTIAENEDFSKYHNYLNVRYQFINEFTTLKDFTTAVKVLANYVFPSKPRISEKNPIHEQEFDESVSSFGNLFNGVIKKIKEDFVFDNPQDIIFAITSARRNVIKLMDIVEEIESDYTKIKRKKNSLDFNDLEDKMLKLLESDNIRVALKSQYKYIFVDEYQDINDKQEKILLQLVSGNNYYMIGDVKQSIYAFRQSSPKIFVDKYNSFSSPDNDDKVIKFNINYRSDRNILEFANSVFDKIITRSTIGIDYKSDSRFESTKEFIGSNIKINIIDDDGESDEKDLLEAKLIAEEITNYVSIKKADGSNYKYGDIAIILRQRGTFVKTLCDVLNDFQIPVRATINSDFFSTSEIGLMIAILKVISNYKDDTSLAIVLKNLFNICEDELMCIRAFDDNLPFYECVLSYEQDDELKQKISKFFDFIESSRIKLSSTTIKDYLREVIDEFNIVPNLKVQVKGLEKVDNILEFLRIADNVNYEYNIDKFLEYLEIISKDNTLKTIGNNNAVEICTIHHSKGLEYPVVILGRLGKKYQLNKDSGNIIINGKFGVGLKSIDNVNRTLNETIIRNACKIENKKSEIDEEIRLLYVAMTRAKEKLSLVGMYDLSKLKENMLRPIYSTNNPFDMIFKSLKQGDVPNFLSQKEFKINSDLNSVADVKIYSIQDFNEEIIKNNVPIILNVENTDLKETLQKIHNIHYDNSSTTIKNTVTNILKEESDYENLNFLPKKLNTSDKIPSGDVLALGTAYHSVMEKLKFNENFIDIEEIISNLVSAGDLEKDLAEKINISDILKCINNLKPLINDSSKIYQEKQFLLCENYNKLVGFSDNNTKVIVQGVIDLVVVKDDEVYLIDYKTNRGVTESQLSEMYGLQLEIYSKAYEYATSIKVDHKCLYSFYLNKLIEIK